MTNIYILFSMILFCMSCKTEEHDVPFFNSADFKPEWISPQSSEYNNIHKIADFSFVNQEGETVTNEVFNESYYITNFFFTTCPGICPEMMSNMYELQEDYSEFENIKFISHTVTPWIDTVEQLKRYAIEYDINTEVWHLVTGKREVIYDLARTSYFVDGEIGLQLSADDFLHTENFLLIDKQRRIRGIYNGTVSKDLDRLKRDLNHLQAMPN